MKNNIFFIIILFIFFILFSLFVYYSQGKRTFVSYSTPGATPINGEVWNKLTEIDKFMYLAGYYRERDTVPGVGNLYKQRAQEESQFQNIIIKDLQTSLDRFYSDPTNKKIPVSQARDFVLRKIRGVRVDSEQKIQKDIEEARSKFQ